MDVHAGEGLAKLAHRGDALIPARVRLLAGEEHVDVARTFDAGSVRRVSLDQISIRAGDRQRRLHPQAGIGMREEMQGELRRFVADRNEDRPCPTRCRVVYQFRMPSAGLRALAAVEDEDSAVGTARE